MRDASSSRCLVARQPHGRSRHARSYLAKLPTIGFLRATTPAGASQWVGAFVQRLRELGWIEGRTVAIRLSLVGCGVRADDVSIASAAPPNM
jgi:hypothetical protein